METYVKAFNPRFIKRDILNVLIRKSSVLEIDGGDKAYNHLTDSLVERGSLYKKDGGMVLAFGQNNS